MKLSFSSSVFFLVVGLMTTTTNNNNVNAFQVPNVQKQQQQQQIRSIGSTLQHATSTTTTVTTTTSLNMAASMMDGAMSNELNDSSSSSSKKNSKSSSPATTVDWDWKKVAKDVFETDDRPIVLFDGVCNLCNSGINFAMDQDETAKFRFCSLHSKVAQSLLLQHGRDPNDNSNIMLITKNKGAFYSSDAVSRICMDLDAAPLQWFGHLGQFTPVWVRESIYKFVSENRYKFGENDSCRLDFDGTYTSRFISDPMELPKLENKKKEPTTNEEEAENLVNSSSSSSSSSSNKNKKMTSDKKKKSNDKE